MGIEERRQHHVERIKNFLAQRGNPRGQMFLILMGTGLAGFLTAALLRLLGLDSMGFRYLLSVGAAYLAFLGMLGIWIAAHRRREAARRCSSSGPLIDGYYGDPFPYGAGPVFVDSGGSSASTGSSGSGGSSGGSSLDVGDGEGLIILVVLLIIVALLAALFASVWVLMDAPVLMAELLVDGAIMTGMARRLRPIPGQHWTFTAIGRTWIPFLITAGAFCVVGFALQSFVPGATTMFEAVNLAMR